LENSVTKDESAMIDLNPAQTSFSLKGNLADRLFLFVKRCSSGVIAWERVQIV